MAKSILVNFSTHFGDTILALPAFDKVCALFPNAKITAIVSPHTKEFLMRHSYIDEVVVYDKHMSLRQKISFFLSLKGKYEVMIDFKHTLIPVFIGAKAHTALFRCAPPNIHSREVYNMCIKKFGHTQKEPSRAHFVVTEEEKMKWDAYRLGGAICVAASSNSPIKEYPYHHLKRIVETLSQKGKVVLLGDNKAHSYYRDIGTIPGVTNLVGKTSFLDVYYILSRYASACITVDSSIMHLASYTNIPLLALFGPTDVIRYGPWSERCTVLLKEKVFCRPCNKAVCAFNHECMDIEPKRVVGEVFLLNSYENP